MADVRRCDARCHDAEGPVCVCWCGGLFHGSGGEAARQAFREAFKDDVSVTEDGRRWLAGIEAAKAARAAGSSLDSTQISLNHSELHLGDNFQKLGGGGTP